MREIHAQTATTYGTLTIVEDAESLARVAADRLVAWATETTEPVRVALSGGSTPRRTYQQLVSPRLLHRVPWPRIHWFWGDERFVPYDHPDSNFGMVRNAMLAAAPIPGANIHPIPTVDVTPDQAVAEYERVLRLAYGADELDRNRPLFDICLLGLGDDGHTASLIPGEPVLHERKRWVAKVAHGRPETRITLTYPPINSSRRIVFLVSGIAKRDILRAVHEGGSDTPAAQLAPFGNLLFIADRAAAGA